MVSKWEGDGLWVWGPGCGKRRPEAWGVAQGKSVVEGIQLMGAVLEGRDPRLSGGTLRLAASCSSCSSPRGFWWSPSGVCKGI